MTTHIREGTPDDVPAALLLFPRLADFELPPNRTSKELWAGDAELLQLWGKGESPESFLYVAVDEAGTILGASLTTLRKEFLSAKPSAHLQALVVADGAEGQGIGRRLIEAAEEAAQAKGAFSLTLHVFGNNSRARGLYERHGFDEELIRCIKHFD